MCCFCSLNKIKTVLRCVYCVVNIRLWGNLSLENLNLQHRLEIIK